MSTQEEIVSDFVESFLNRIPQATLSLDRPVARLPRPDDSHADWRSLPALALDNLFPHLPVPDLVRLGYLFTPSWREVWRRYPLQLHDRQFASLPIPRSEVANAITNVLEEYVDGVEEEGVAAGCRRVWSFRVESTEWGPDHAARWCAALQRGGATKVVLFNRSFGGQPAMLVRVPLRLLECTSVRTLHLGFFTVEAGELDALTGTTDLGLYGCACRPGVVEGVVLACRDLQRLSVEDGVLDSVVLRSPPRLWSLSMFRTVSRSLIVDDAPILKELIIGSTPGRLSISRAPNLTYLTRLSLPDTTLEIDGTVITVDRQAIAPQILSVRKLWLALDYTALRGMEEHMVPRMVQQMLMRFPFVTSLTIERKDDVPDEEGLASRYDGHTHGHLNLFVGLVQRLRTLTLLEFRAGKAELALAKALMELTQPMCHVELKYDGPVDRNAAVETRAAVRQFAEEHRSLGNPPFVRNLRRRIHAPNVNFF